MSFRHHARLLLAIHLKQKMLIFTFQATKELFNNLWICFTAMKMSVSHFEHAIQQMWQFLIAQIVFFHVNTLTK